MNMAIEYIQKSQLVVSHAGIGTIILCKKYGIPILILPRRKRYGEHMNDHQLEIAQALEKEKVKISMSLMKRIELKEKILENLETRGEV